MKRNLKKTILDSLNRYPIVGLIGCRQVGKTILAKMQAEELAGQAVYLDLELPSDLAKLQF